jgi:hypothetical protein
MKRNIGIWIDSKHAVIITLVNEQVALKKIESNIEFRVRIPGEAKKFGRFGGQYLTYEKNRLMRKTHQTNQFLRSLIKEIISCDAVVIFGPSNMKKMLEKEILKTANLTNKLQGVYNAELMTDNQMKAWVRDYYKKA